MIRLRLLLSLLCLPALSHAQAYSLQFVDTKTDASFRSMSVGDNNAIWVSGSKGWIGRSVNAGKDWTFRQVPGYENCDFRALHAFDADHAVLTNVGSPAYVLRTSDGGNTWQQVYKNTDSLAFIDGIDFWDDKHGMIHGDPIAGRMMLLYTSDGGKSWTERKESSRPQMAEGEAFFAASATTLRCMPHKTIVAAAGGRTSQLFLSRNRGKKWRSIPTPMLAGLQTTGIFSFLPLGDGHWLIAGGDYMQDTLRKANCFYTLNKGKVWQAPVTTTGGYRECLAQVERKDPDSKTPVRTIFAVGPTGIDMSTDDGVNWRLFSAEQGFHVIRPGRDQQMLFLAGGKGKLAVIRSKP